ncbi:MAG TPA: PA2779 family protein [Thermoanaerobaculia bacterium]|nr:PA2779 family protein [Thermoanaerobaculia bacterium]
MHTSLHRLVILGLGVLALAVAFTAPAQALPAPSKTAADQALTERASDLAALNAVLDQKEVMAVLAGQGFTRDEVNERLAQLSPQELSTLAAQTDQLQAAGQPMYIWVLIAVLIVVAIVAVAN